MRSVFDRWADWGAVEKIPITCWNVGAPSTPILAGTPESWSPCCGVSCPGGLVKSWLLAVPGLASLLSDCVRSNPTLEWAELTFEPQTCLNPSDTRAPGCGLVCGFFCLWIFFFFFWSPRQVRKYPRGYRSPSRMSGVSGHCYLLLFGKIPLVFSASFLLERGLPSCMDLSLGSLQFQGTWLVVEKSGPRNKVNSL